MRRIIGVVVLVLALVGGGVTAAYAAPANSSSEKVTILHNTTERVDTAIVDVGDPGPSIGDRFTFLDNVYEGKERVGQVHGNCTTTHVYGTGPDATITALCVDTAVLKGGQVSAQGASTFTVDGAFRPFYLSVTGGTQKYRAVGGEILVRPVGDGKKAAELIVRLVR